MALTRKDVEWVAHLSRLDLPDDALDKMTEQLGAVLSYFEKLNELETKNVPPMSHPGALKNVFREDEPREPLPRDAALRNSPDKADGIDVSPHNPLPGSKGIIPGSLGTYGGKEWQPKKKTTNKRAF